MRAEVDEGDEMQRGFSEPKQLLAAITERKHKPKVIKFNPVLMETRVQGRGAPRQTQDA